MENLDHKSIIMGILVSLGVLELLFAKFHQSDKVKGRDYWLEAFGTAFVFLVSAPTAVFMSDVGYEYIVPQWRDAWAGLPFWLMFVIFIFADDMVQYWWHRTCHEVPWMYNLHRAHHTPEYMGIRVTYRNSFAYSFFVPILWISAFLVYLGLGPAYALFIIIKYVIILNAHSTLKWDQYLYRFSWLRPVAWVVQRTISTPATHHAHHGKHLSDGKTHYKGNYGNMLFLWDVVFGTAHITQEYPDEYGVENLEPKSWMHEQFFPIVNEKDKGSVTAQDQPAA